MLNRDSLAYRAGRGFGKVILISLGYIIGKKRWGQKPIRKSLPEKNNTNNIN